MTLSIDDHIKVYQYVFVFTSVEKPALPDDLLSLFSHMQGKTRKLAYYTPACSSAQSGK